MKSKFLIVLLSIALATPWCEAKVAEKEAIDIDINSPSLPAFATTYETCYLVDNTNLAIFLSDGSQWIVQTKEIDKANNSIFRKWKIGDDIRIKPKDNDEESFIMKNVRNKEVFIVKLDKNCINDSHAHFIKKMDKNGYVIKTDNDSEWAIGWIGSFKTEKWRRKDRIIINKSDFHSKEDYCLINARDSTSCWGTLVDWK